MGKNEDAGRIDCLSDNEETKEELEKIEEEVGVFNSEDF